MILKDKYRILFFRLDKEDNNDILIKISVREWIKWHQWNIENIRKVERKLRHLIKKYIEKWLVIKKRLQEKEK